MAAIFNPTIVFFILGLSGLGFIVAQKGGFTVELIHRDSPKSPLYNASETTSDRVINSLRRSLNRAHRFRQSSVDSTIDAPEADVIAGTGGEYLMKISIGTPPFDIIAVADTGSDLIWTQCQPCSLCFEENAPLFNPGDSSTYKPISCSASQCSNQVTGVPISCSGDNTCKYETSYIDGSFSNGDLATDTLTLPSPTGPPVLFSETTIGCARNSSGKFEKETSGIIGLGGGNLSLISQLGSSIDGKFSYCLSSVRGVSSKMNFGSNAVVSGDGVVSTPLTKKSEVTFYHLTLEAVSVGSNRIEFTGSRVGQSDDGNIIIDSGTTYTLVPEDFYQKLEYAVYSQINATRVNGPLKDLNLCYEAQGELAVPDITVHFTDADVVLQPVNTFLKVSQTVYCFIFTTYKNSSIYGNLAQINFLVGYDTQKQTVSFKPTDCSKD